MTTPIRVGIADDHAFLREGVRRILEQEPDLLIVGLATNGSEALELVERERPDVLVTDVQMPVRGGLAVLQEIRRRQLPTRVVILTVSSDHHAVLSLIEAGAMGYVLKENTTTDLIAAIRAVAVGRHMFVPAIAALIDEVRGGGIPADGGVKLTRREHEVLILLARGHRAGAIAARLGISPRTVEAHRSSLYRKLAVHNGRELVLVALRHGLVTI